MHRQVWVHPRAQSLRPRSRESSRKCGRTRRRRSSRGLRHSQTKRSLLTSGCIPPIVIVPKRRPKTRNKTSELLRLATRGKRLAGKGAKAPWQVGIRTDMPLRPAHQPDTRLTEEAAATHTAQRRHRAMRACTILAGEQHCCATRNSPSKGNEAIFHLPRATADPCRVACRPARVSLLRRMEAVECIRTVTDLPHFSTRRIQGRRRCLGSSLQGAVQRPFTGPIQTL